MPQLSSAGQNMIDDVTRRQKRSGADACRAVNTLRVRKQIDAVSVTAVHNYINGATHARGRADRRGHGQRLLTTVHVRKLAAARRRLIKKVDGARRVTYADVIAEAKLDVSCCQRTVMDAMRDEGIAYRPARAKVQITEEDAKKRLEFAEEWRVKPPSFWTNSVHGFLDCKAWPAPLTPKQRKKYSQTRVVGHLRYPVRALTAASRSRARSTHGSASQPSTSPRWSLATALSCLRRWKVLGMGRLLGRCIRTSSPPR